MKLLPALIGLNLGYTIVELETEVFNRRTNLWLDLPRLDLASSGCMKNLRFAFPRTALAPT